MRKLPIIILAVILIMMPSCANKKEDGKKAAPSKTASAGMSPGDVFRIFVKALGEGNTRAAWDCFSLETKRRHDTGTGDTVDLAAAYKNFETQMKKTMNDEKKRIQVTSAVVENQQINGKQAVIKVIYTKLGSKGKSPESAVMPETKSIRLNMILTGDGWKIHSPGPLAHGTIQDKKPDKVKDKPSINSNNKGGSGGNSGHIESGGSMSSFFPNQKKTVGFFLISLAIVLMLQIGRRGRKPPGRKESDR